MPKEFYNRIVNEFLGGGNYGMQVQKKNVRLAVVRPNGE